MTMTNETIQLTRSVGGADVPLAGTYELDKTHTVIAFVARHLMVTKVRGTFSDFDGSFVVAENPLDSRLKVEVRTASIETGTAQRDDHLRSSDFLEQEKFPTMTYESTSVVPAGDGHWTLNGKLTLRGVTREVPLDVEFNGAVLDPWGGVRVGFSATGEINRHDFGVSFNAPLEGGGVVVGDKVKIEIESEAVLKQ
jgi:polyisoprenoid-binding protein YceI